MFIASIIDAIRRYLSYRSDLAIIGRLDERTLRDIGVSRIDVMAARRITARSQYL